MQCNAMQKMRPCLCSPEGRVRLAAKLVETIVDCRLKHPILQETDKGSGGADLTPGVVEGDLHVCVLLLLVHKSAQPWLGMGRQLIPAGRGRHEFEPMLLQA